MMKIKTYIVNKTFIWLNLDSFLHKCKNLSIDFLIELLEFVDNIEDCQLIISECSSPIIRLDKMNIIFCGESDTCYNYTNLMNSENDNIKFIGTIEDGKNSINCPMINWNSLDNDLYKIKVFNTLPSFNERIFNKNKCCFIRKQNNKKIYREQIFLYLNISKCYENPIDANACIRLYLFNFCAENSLSTYNGTGGYITEKIFRAIANKCIPIYYGGNLEKYTYLNTNRIIQLKSIDDAKKYDFSNIDAFKDMFNLELFRSDYNEFLNYRKNKLHQFLYKVLKTL